MARWRRLIATALGSAAAIAIRGGGLSALAPGRSLIPDDRSPVTATPAASGLAYADVAFADAQGTILRGWWIPGARPLAIVMVHPWGANRADLLGRVGYLHQAGYSLLLFDLSGHGDSAGDMRSFDWLNGLDVEAAVAFAAARSGRRVAVIGYSLGAAPGPGTRWRTAATRRATRRPSSPSCATRCTEPRAACVSLAQRISPAQRLSVRGRSS